MSKQPPQPPFAFTHDFEPPTTRFKVPSKLAKKLPEVIGAGIYKIYVAAEFPDGHEPLNEINFPTVTTHSDVPMLDWEQIAQLILALCYDHNLQARRQCKYRVRFKAKREAGGAHDAGYCTFPINATLEYDDSSSSAPEPTHPAVQHPAMQPVYGGVAYDPNDPTMLLMSHLGLLMQETRLILCEARKDVSAAREYAENAHEKLYDVVTSNLKHTDAQAKINQAGWDALHRGVDMQAQGQQRDWQYWKQIQDLNTQIAMLEAQQKNAGGGLIEKVMPLLMLGMMSRFGPGGIPPQLMGLMKSVMGGDAEAEEADEEDVPDAEFTDTTPPSPPPPVDPDDLVLEHVASPAEIKKFPIRSMCRLLDRMITAEERTAVQQVLTAPQWASLEQLLQSSTDEECAFGLMQLATDIGEEGNQRLLAALRPRPRKLIQDIGNFASKKFSGQTPKVPRSATTPPPPSAPEPRPAPEPEPDEVRTIGTTYCGACGSPNPKGFRFCGGCGGQLGHPHVPEDRAPIPQPPAASPPAPPPPPPPPPPPDTTVDTAEVLAPETEETPEVPDPSASHVPDTEGDTEADAPLADSEETQESPEGDPPADKVMTDADAATPKRRRRRRKKEEKKDDA